MITGLCNRCGHTHELDSTAPMCGTFTTVYNGPALSGVPRCESCITLEARLAQLEAENAHLREAFTMMERAANQHEASLCAVRMENEYIREIFDRVEADCDALRDQHDTVLAHANELERENAALRADLALARALIEKACDALSDDEPIAPDELVEACAVLWAKLDTLQKEREDYCALEIGRLEVAKLRADLDRAREDVERAFRHAYRTGRQVVYVEQEDAAWRAYQAAQDHRRG